MEEDISVTARLRRLEKYVRTLPAQKRLLKLDRDARNSFLDVQDCLSDAIRLANDAEKSDKPVIRQDSFTRCIERLEAFIQAILLASQFDLLDAADIAQLSVMAEQAIDTSKASLVQA